MIGKLHIGKIISEIMVKKNCSHKEIAEQLGIPEPIFDLMLRNDDLGCNILFRISKILDHDFFRHYSNHLTYSDFAPNGFDKSEKKKVKI